MHLDAHLPLRDSLRRQLSSATQLPVSTSLSNSAFANVSAQDHDVVATADLSTNISIVPRVVSTLPPFASTHFHAIYSLECHTRPIFSLSLLAEGIWVYEFASFSPFNAKVHADLSLTHDALAPFLPAHIPSGCVYGAYRIVGVSRQLASYALGASIPIAATFFKLSQRHTANAFRIPFLSPTLSRCNAHSRGVRGFIARTYGASFSFPFYRHCRNALLYARKR